MGVMRACGDWRVAFQRSRFFAGVALGGVLLLGLSACASAPKDIAPYAFSCSQGQFFEARLYRDMAVLEGARGHDQLQRVQAAGADKGEAHQQGEAPNEDLSQNASADITALASHGFTYGNARVVATFGLGVDRRLATLRYADIPQTIHCERVQLRFAHTLAQAMAGASSPDAPLPPLEIASHDGPKPPAKPQPIPMQDRIYTNIRFGGELGPNAP